MAEKKFWYAPLSNDWKVAASRIWMTRSALREESQRWLAKEHDEGAHLLASRGVGADYILNGNEQNAGVRSAVVATKEEWVSSSSQVTGSKRERT